MVFPEGTRSETGEILRFHKGAFQLAQALKVDLLPVFIHGAHDVMPKNDIVLREGQLYVEIDQRISAQEVSSMDARALTSKVHKYYIEHYAEIRKQRENTAYVLPYVRYKYVYKGREVEHACRRNLKKIKLQAAEIDALNQDAIEIKVNDQGELAWTMALVHRNMEVRALIDDEDTYLLASHCSYIPDNLHFTKE